MTLEDTLLRALMDTLMGMGTVFMILILICLIISLFKFIPKESTAAAGTDVSVPAAPAMKDEEDDGELAAVIIAAIKMAIASEAKNDSGQEEGEPAFIVKSVKRRR